MVDQLRWLPCALPKKGDTLRWNEPIWAEPNKPRGKPDKIGEQQIMAKVVKVEEFIECSVISVQNLGQGNVPIKVKENDSIKRKKSTLALGNCHKLLS